jgi:ABC-type multidrug transport system permease subunit
MLFAIIVYFTIHFEFDTGKFFFFWLTLFLTSLIMAYLGMVMVCITPNLQMGVTMGATALGFWFLFAGFMITRPLAPPWWRWVVYLCPTSWSIYAVAADQLMDKVCPFAFISEQRKP